MQNKTKICNICKQQKSLILFSKNKSTKDGYSPRCKSCSRELELKYRGSSGVRYTVLNPRNKIENGIEYFKCTFCGKEKTANEFHKDKAQTHGLSHQCKICMRESRLKKIGSDGKKRSILNPKMEERNGILYRICGHCNIEKEILEFRTAPDNRDGYRSCCKQCEREKCTARSKKIRESGNLQMLLKILIQSSRSRAKRKGVKCDKTEDLLEELYPKTVKAFKCQCCGKILKLRKDWKDGMSIDRVDNEKGYVVGNVALICRRCNFLKNESSLKELKMLVAYVENFYND
jgi:hypothetical protein